MTPPLSSSPSLPPLVVVGSINQDVSARTVTLPRAGETVGGGTLSVQAGGKGANQAVAAARLGAPTSLIGAVGDDDAGRYVLGRLREAGVSTERIASSAAATGTALIVVDAAGENQIAVCPGANADIRVDSDGIPEDAVVLTQLEVPIEVVAAAARLQTRYFALNAAPACPLPAELIERCDLIIVNETEYAELPELSAARLVAVTYGADGAALLEHGQEVARVPAVRTEVVNSVGAGDAFCAALTLGLAAGVEAEAALRVAAAVGADAVAHEASQPPLRPWAEYAAEVSDRGLAGD
jgi:Sugar kinases, ribokinase family